MRKVILIFVLAISTTFILAQGRDENSNMTKKEKRNAEIERQYIMTKNLLEDRNFVLESDFLHNRYGYRYWVNSNINFVKIDSTTAVIQIGSIYRVGPNGVGGVTAKGLITKWELTENIKNKTFNLMMNVMTPIGIYDLQFNISPSGRATARLTGMRSGRLTFEGDLVPLEESAVYQGWSL